MIGGYDYLVSFIELIKIILKYRLLLYTNTIKRSGIIIMYEEPSYIVQKPSSWPKTILD